MYEKKDLRTSLFCILLIQLLKDRVSATLTKPLSDGGGAGGLKDRKFFKLEITD